MAWLDPFTKRVLVTIPAGQVSGTVSDYRGVVRSADLPAGSIEAVTGPDGDTAWPFDLRTGDLYYRAISAVSSSGSTLYIYIDPSTSYTHPYADTDVWTNRSLVCPMEEASGDLEDLAANVISGARVGHSQISGAISNAQAYSTNDYSSFPHSVDLEPGASDFYFRCLFRTNETMSAGKLITLFGKGNYAVDGAHVYTSLRGGSTFKGLSISARTSSSNYQLIPNTDLNATVSDGNWHSFTYIIERGAAEEFRAYLDGDYIGGIASLGGANFANTRPLKLHAYVSFDDYDIDLDHVVVAKSVPPDNFILTQSRNFLDPGNFYTVGAIENKPVSAPRRRTAILR